MVDLPHAATPSNRAAAAMKVTEIFSIAEPYIEPRADRQAPYRGGA
jgi:hypothetical protein